MVIVKADDSGHVTDQGVAIGVTSLRGNGVASENSGNTTHEGRFTAARVSSETNNYDLVIGSPDDDDTAGGRARWHDGLNIHGSTEASLGTSKRGVGSTELSLDSVGASEGSAGSTGIDASVAHVSAAAGHCWLESLSCRRHIS